MAFKIQTADERLARPHHGNFFIAGKSGIGKTTLARTLPAEDTVFIDLEAGTMALDNWGGDVIDVRKEAAEMGVHPWALSRAIACVMCGPDPAATDPSDPYSKESYAEYCAALGGPDVFAKYKHSFWDSATVAARHSFSWSQTQPEAISEKTGKPDTRGAYGLHGREMVKWLTTIQHIKDMSTVVLCILNEEVDDLRRVTYSLQLDGGKAKNELPGIFDNIMTLSSFQTEEGKEYRALVCQNLNEWSFPAKDRSGRLDILEPPDLAHILAKTAAGPRQGALVRTMPGVDLADTAS